MKALDLYCCGGGASAGLAAAGFEVTGIDIDQQPMYRHDFIQKDALTVSIRFIRQFDLVWASPPCQFASCVTPKSHRLNHKNYIPETRELLRKSGVPYIIENVPAARRFLVNPFKLCGSMFGLKSYRHRFFETSFACHHQMECNHNFMPLLVTTAGAYSRKLRQPGQYKSVKNAPAAYGIDWMRSVELKEAIPPAYAEWIAKAFLAQKID